MSSYLNAVKSGKSVTGTPPAAVQPEKPIPLQQALAPPVPDEAEDVQLEEEGVDENIDQDYDDNNQSINIVNRGNKKNTGSFSRLEFENEEKEDDFWRLLAETAGPAGLCSFGLTCTYFFDKLLSTKDLWILVQPQLPPIINPIVNILVETSLENAGQEKILTLPITSLKQPYQKQHLVDYWLKILAKAESERDTDKNKDPTQHHLNATLNGGFNIESGSGKNTQTIVYLQDLSVVHKVLNAIGQLLNRKTRFVKLPYRNGNIILSLYGRGGTCISLNVKGGKDNNIKTIFPLEDFANQSRKAAKKFVALVGYCRVYLRRPSHESTEKENWILNVLAHDSLNQDVHQIRNKLASGVVPGSTLPAHFQKKIQLTKKKQNQDDIENSDIMDLINLNLPEQWKDVYAAKERLEKSATEQRENERLERQARREREKLEAQERKKREKEEAEGKKNEENQDDEQAPKKPKTYLINRKDTDGWVTVTVVDEEGKQLEKPKPEEKPEKPKKIKQPKEKKEDNSHSNNIFTIVSEEDNVISPAEYQASLREAKSKGQQQQPQPPQKNKPPRNKPENKENGKEPDFKKSAKNKQKKPSKEVSEGSKKQQHVVKDVPLWQNDLFKPLVYVFAFVTLISVLYLTLN